MKDFYNVKKRDLNYLQAKRRYNIKPFKDSDKDGLINLFDCRPFDKNKQGLIHAIIGYDKENKAKLILRDAKKILEQAVIEYQKGNTILGEKLEQQAQDLAKQAQELFESGKTEISIEKKRIKKNIQKGLQVKKQKKIKTHTPPYFIVRKEPVEKLYTLPWIRKLRESESHEQKKSMFTPHKARIIFIR